MPAMKPAYFLEKLILMFGWIGKEEVKGRKTESCEPLRVFEG
jgi:hypothetical protein